MCCALESFDTPPCLDTAFSSWARVMSIRPEPSASLNHAFCLALRKSSLSTSMCGYTGLVRHMCWSTLNATGAALASAIAEFANPCFPPSTGSVMW